MPKLLKSEHLNDELWKAEKSLENINETGTGKLGVKILILLTKLIRDIRHNQVSIMKKIGCKLSEGKNKEGDV